MLGLGSESICSSKGRWGARCQWLDAGLGPYAAPHATRMPNAAGSSLVALQALGCAVLERAGSSIRPYLSTAGPAALSCRAARTAPAPPHRRTIAFRRPCPCPLQLSDALKEFTCKEQCNAHAAVVYCWYCCFSCHVGGPRLLQTQCQCPVHSRSGLHGAQRQPAVMGAPLEQRPPKHSLLSPHFQLLPRRRRG